MEKLVTYLSKYNIRRIGPLKSSIMISNLPVRRGYLILAHSMNGEQKHTKMPSCLKKKLKDDMIKESKSMSLKLENVFSCTTLVSGSLQENSSKNGKAPTS